LSSLVSGELCRQRATAVLYNSLVAGFSPGGRKTSNQIRLRILLPQAKSDCVDDSNYFELQGD
jgi:hypothetical protein